ncbi:MAG TPA: hypothetical protein VGE52_04425, partial [Pirellulales bacterium]
GEMLASAETAALAEAMKNSLPTSLAEAELLAGVSRSVGIDEARRLAAANSPDARRTIHQAAFARSIAPCVDGEERTGLLLEADLADLTAKSEQNQAATDAGTALLALLDAQVKRDGFERIAGELQASREHLVKAEEEGLVSPDLDDVDAQISDARRGAQAASLAASQANQKLAVLLGLKADDVGLLQPRVDLADPGPAVAPTGAISLALEERPEILQLQIMLSRLNERTLPMASKAGISVPGPARPPQPSMPTQLLPVHNQDEIAKFKCDLARFRHIRGLQVGYTREQLVIKHDQAKRETEQAITAALLELDSRAREIELAAEALQTRKDRVARLESRAGVVDVPPLEQFQARVAVLRAEQDFVGCLIARKRAWLGLYSALSLAAEPGPLAGLRTGKDEALYVEPAREDPAPQPAT